MLSILCIEKTTALTEVFTYLHDTNGTLTIEDVKASTFNTTSKNNLGTTNGIYWFRINDAHHKRAILELRNPQIKDLTLYDSGGTQVSMMGDTRFPSFFLVNKNLNYPLFLKVDFPLGAYFPIKQSTEEEYARNDKLSLLVSGLFYGTALALFMATLIFSLIFRRKQFLFFSMLVLSVAVCIIGKDSILVFLNVSSTGIQIVESLGHVLIGLSVTGFIVFVIKIERDKIYLQHLVIALSGLALIAFAIFSVTYSLWAFALVDICAMLIFLLLGFFIHKLGNIYLQIAVLLFYVLDSLLLINASILHTLGIDFLESTLLVVSFIAILNFTFIAFYLLISLRKIQILRLKNQHKIKHYIAQIRKLDAYKNIQDSDDEYMQSLIYKFNLENMEIKVLSQISKNRSNNYIEEKYDLSKERLQSITNNIYEKLGIQATQKFSQLAVK